MNGLSKHTFYTLLSTLNGELKRKIEIEHLINNDEITVEVTAVLNYDGIEYKGFGNDYLWIDAIANLQKHLPENVIIKCCLTCRHGSLCPVGNNENELFCVKDIVPKNKEDLFFCTEDYKQREKRSREYFSCCSDYRPQSDDYFTYNDYLYYLNKKN